MIPGAAAAPPVPAATPATSDANRPAVVNLRVSQFNVLTILSLHPLTVRHNLKKPNLSDAWFLLRRFCYELQGTSEVLRGEVRDYDTVTGRPWCETSVPRLQCTGRRIREESM